MVGVVRELWVWLLVVFLASAICTGRLELEWLEHVSPAEVAD